MDEERLPVALERPTQTFSSRAVDVLREMVLDGRLRAGERLNEVELANALGISRGPLREAIQRLRSEGLLTAVSGRGAFVRTFTSDSLKELYEVRIALETHAIRLMARRTSAADIGALRRMLSQTSEAMAGDDKAYPGDLDFHQQLVTLAGNKMLTESVTEVHQQISLARSRSGHVRSRAKKALDEHQQILELIEMGQIEKSAKALTAHLRKSLENALDVLSVKDESASA